jgi:hypothetical protein
MPKKLDAEEWAEYLGLYGTLSENLAREEWFANDWQTHFDYLNRENPRGAWFQLVRKNWFDGAIHLETWINNSTLQSGTTPLVLHVETSIPKLFRFHAVRVAGPLPGAGGCRAGWRCVP